MSNGPALGGVAAVVLLALVGGCSVLVHTTSQAEVRGVVVTDKERVTTSDSDGKVSSKYLIFTDEETFENVDSMLAMKFNSSDVYGRIKRGQTCDFRVVGYRMPFFSAYRNILEAKCAGESLVRTD